MTEHAEEYATYVAGWNEGLAAGRREVLLNLNQEMIDAVRNSKLSGAEISRRAGIPHTLLSRMLNGRATGSVQMWQRILRVALQD